ncbi:hypothetical protein WN48_07110 [Eufriesea mexicana]|uniref:Endonuclease/exonuclease/phosphatase domain-containing protein n=1 Tax=Eufriesea mexicana TaxID=516756 RepID=A0A310SJB5_9HYME|nr:hypothetical protein WN48_07110 [Eufriesea mexicana]
MTSAIAPLGNFRLGNNKDPWHSNGFNSKKKIVSIATEIDKHAANEESSQYHCNKGSNLKKRESEERNNGGKNPRATSSSHAEPSSQVAKTKVNPAAPKSNTTSIEDREQWTKVGPNKRSSPSPAYEQRPAAASATTSSPKGRKIANDVVYTSSGNCHRSTADRSDTRIREFLASANVMDTPERTAHTHSANKLVLKRLNIIEINVNSIITNERRATLLDCLNVHKPDIALLCETKVNPRHRIVFENDNFVRTDRFNAKQAGGTGIVMRKDIKFRHICLDHETTNKSLESTVIEIKLQGAAKLFVIAGYAANNCKKEFIVELKSLFRQLELYRANNYQLSGDLNSKHHSWGNAINNSRRISLNRWTLENHIPYRLSIHRTTIPSYPKSKAFIDLRLADNRIKFHNTPSYNTLDSFEYDSDHRAILIEISIPSMEMLEIDELVTSDRHNFHKADWTKFAKFLTKTHVPDIPNDRNLTLELPTQ